MPYVTILGVTFWYPDLTDLYNYIVKPVVDWIESVKNYIVNTVYSWFQWIPSAVYNALLPILNPIWQFIQGIATSIYNLLSPLINQIWSRIQPLLSQISTAITQIASAAWNLMKPTLDLIYQTLKGVASAVWGYIKPWWDALIALLQGNFAPLLSLIVGVVQAVLKGITTMFPALQLALAGLDVGLTGLRAQVQGQPAEFEKILAAKLNEILNPLAKIPEDFFKAFNDYIVKPVMAALQGALSTLDQYFRQFGQIMLDAIHSIAAGGPEQAVARATATAVALGGLVTAVNIAAQTIELIHPIKHMGIVGTVTSILDVMGIRPFAQGMLAAIVAGAIYKPVYQGLAIMYRPEIPPLSMADTMLFQQQISAAEWQRVYGLTGWPEKYITAWHGSMYTEPSDRMIVGMVEGGEVELEWLDGKLRARGYRPEDAARILRYGTRKALADEIKAIISEVQSDLLEGQIDLLDAEQELKAIGIKGTELTFRVSAMRRRIQRRDTKDKIDILTAQVKQDEITVDQYRNELIALNLRMPRVNALVEKEEARRKPRVEKPAETKRQLAISFYTRLFIEQTIEETQLRTYLTALTPKLKEEDLELIITDAKIERAKAIARAVPPEWVFVELFKGYKVEWSEAKGIYRATVPGLPVLENPDLAALRETIEPTVPKTRELGTSFYVRIYVAGQIEEPQLIEYLTALTPPYSPESLELVLTDARTRRAAKEAAAAKFIAPPRPPELTAVQWSTLQYYGKLLLAATIDESTALEVVTGDPYLIPEEKALAYLHPFYLEGLRRVG